ncbi:hypothetical protein FKM82_007376 [Ascaphus truei]
MDLGNWTMISEFFLVGFESRHLLKIPLFVFFSIVFLATLLGNLVIIAIVFSGRQLQSPMYFFLCNLSLADIFLITITVPNMLHVIIEEGSRISVPGCITQFYFFSGSTITECFLLGVMSYDRYLAICNPLRYASIMVLRLCVHMVVWSWLLGYMLPLISAISISVLIFCGPSVIDHFFCDLSPLLKLSCSDTSTVELELLVFSTPIFIFPCVFIIVTYVCIFITIFSISSTTGRQKAFSTCSSHLTVVGTFYGTLIAKYMIPAHGQSLNVNKFISLLHAVFTPLLNPLIYSLRNQDIKAELGRLINRSK